MGVVIFLLCNYLNIWVKFLLAQRLLLDIVSHLLFGRQPWLLFYEGRSLGQGAYEKKLSDEKVMLLFYRREQNVKKKIKEV